MKLSIIIPVFNVEDYIRPCLESILRQGLDEDCYEIIIINDGTPDKSMDVIADIIETNHNIRVIEQENQGISIARNNGIKRASGDYILFIDSDDILIDNSILFLLDKAISSKADLVVADYLKMNDEAIANLEENIIKQKDGIIQIKSGKELFLQDLNPYYCYVWRTMYRREFLNNNNLLFIPHICYEDIPFTQLCYINANLCLRVNWFFIIYRQGHTSITNSFNAKKARDFCTAISELWEISKKENLDNKIKLKLRNNVFIHFSMVFYLLTSSTSIHRSEKISVMYYLKKICPDLTFKNGIKQIIVNFLYQRMPNTYINLRILYARYLQYLLWNIGDTIRRKKNEQI